MSIERDNSRGLLGPIFGEHHDNAIDFGEKPVAFQGVAGAFSEEATVRLFGEQTPRQAFVQFADVFDAVGTGKCSYGVVPLENSLAGSVMQVFDLLFGSEVAIAGEVTLPIQQVLVGAKGSKLADVRKVRSIPVALAQCERFFRDNPQIAPVSAFNTAEAIRDVVEQGDVEVAAIGSKRAADQYGGEILIDDVQDYRENFTRFVVIGNPSKMPEGKLREEDHYKVSLIFTLPHKPGSLCSALSIFSGRHIDLTKIESRSIKGKRFEYLFFADIVSTPSLALFQALGEFATKAKSIRVLGPYPFFS